MKTTNQQITEKEITDYLAYFKVEPDWLFDTENASPKKESWMKSCFTKFTSFGYVHKEGLILKTEMPDGNIERKAFEEMVSLAEINDIKTLAQAINSVKEYETKVRKERAEKVANILNTYTPEEKSKVLQTMNEGAKALAKIQFVAQGKLDLHITDFSSDTLEKLTQYQRVRDEINLHIKQKNRESELEQTRPEENKEIER